MKTMQLSAPKGLDKPAGGNAPGLWSRIFFLAPKGLQQISPGQRPGFVAPRFVPSPERAKQVRCLALSGLMDLLATGYPRRCPGLVCSGAFGAWPHIPSAVVQVP